MDVRGLKRDVQRGTASLDDVLGAVEKLAGRVRRLEGENSRLRQRLAQYEPEVLQEPGAASGDKSGEPLQRSVRYGVADEERRRGHKRLAPQRRGRVPTAEKLKEAQRVECLYPQGVSRQDCEEAAQRVVWRIENGQAVRVGYRLCRGPDGTMPEVADVLPQGEFDVEIVLAVAYLTYLLRLSLDQVCQLVQFFWKLPLAKSQADALLNQLSRQWEPEFGRLCEALALAALVCTDETGWKVGTSSANAAVFATPGQTVLLFDCPKGRDTLLKLLPPQLFAGVLVSDDHASYQGLSRSQKCWAHLLRKAIRLTRLYPENRTYARFLDELLAIYREANHRRQDKRLAETGRRRLLDELSRRTQRLCYPHCWGRTQPARRPAEKDFERLANEVYRLADVGELFTFVLHPEVPGTNNESERLLRGAAQARKLNRTSQSAHGAHRRSVITSVLESMRKNVPDFTLQTVIKAVVRSLATNRSLFAAQLKKHRKALPAALQPG